MRNTVHYVIMIIGVSLVGGMMVGSCVEVNATKRAMNKNDNDIALQQQMVDDQVNNGNISSIEMKEPTSFEVDGKEYKIIVIDSCEYIEHEEGFRYSDHRNYSMTHRGRCKFCKERNKK